MEDLNIKSIISVSLNYKFLDTKKDGYIYFLEQGVAMGRSIEEVEIFLKNPIHDDILMLLKAKVDAEMTH